MRRRDRIQHPKEYRRVLMALVPVAMVALGVYSLLHIAEWQHSAQLPDDYESFQTRHFLVYYPVELEARTRDIVAEAEEFLREAPRAFEPFLGDLQPPNQRIRLTLFRHHQEFVQFTRSSLQEDMSSNGGYFDATHLEIVLVLTEANIDSLGIRHELAHLLVGRGGGRFGTELPRWLNEGLATWLETADIGRPGESGALTGWVQLVAAATTSPPKVREIVAYDGEDFRSHTNDVVYAYTNLLVHFLVARDRDQFFEFARSGRYDNTLGDGGLTEYFGSLAVLEDAFSEYIRTEVARFDALHRSSLLRGESPPVIAPDSGHAR